MSIVVGIAGGTGSGKTTVARAVAGAFLERAIMIEQECFYVDRSGIPLKERKNINLDHPESLDFALMADVLQRLKSGRRVELPAYDFGSNTRKKETSAAGPADVVVVEGVLIFYSEALRNLFDLKVFVQTDADIRVLRRIKKDIEERGKNLGNVLTQYLRIVKPMHEMFVEPSRHYADIIIPEGGFNVLGVETIISQVAKMLKFGRSSR